MLRRLIIALTAAAALAAPAQPASGSDTPGFEVLPPGVPLELPLVVNRAYLGDISVQAEPQGGLLLERDRLVELLARRLTEEAAADLDAALPSVDLVRARDVSPAAEIRLDVSRIEIVADVPLSDLRAREVNFGRDEDLGDIDAVSPARVAAALGVDLGASYAHEGDDIGFSPLAGRLFGFLNLGGSRGWSLDFEGFYNEDAAEPFRRGDLTLFRDFPDSATRLSFGDVLVNGANFQSTPQLGGVAFQRLYSELSPLQSIRATGRTSFVLENDATVDVIVNGNLVRTIRLGAGNYDFSDIPFAEGANLIELDIRQDNGQTQRLSFDAFASASLLKPGLSEFGFSAGLPSTVEDGDVTYDEDQPIATGFYRRGITDRFSLGVSAQASPDVGQLGFEAVRGFEALLVSASTAVSAPMDADDGVTDFAAELDVRLQPDWLEAAGDASLAFNLLYTGRDFADVRSFGTQQRFRWQTGVSGGFSLLDTRISLSASRREAYRGFDDVARYSASASRRLGVLAASASYDLTEAGEEDDHRFLLSLSYRPTGRNMFVRGQYASLDDRYRLEASFLPGGGVNSWSGSVAAETSETGDRLSGNARYRGNRLNASAGHSAVFDALGESPLSQVTSVNLQTGVAFADGAAAIGPVGQSPFAIVQRGPAVEGARLVVNPGERGHRARTDALGAAVVPSLRSFSPGRVTGVVDSDALAFMGQDAVINVVPGTRTGYRLIIGETVTVTIVGRALDVSGLPVARRLGTLQPLYGDRASIDVFTNSGGRFVAEDVVPGIYRLTLDGAGAGILEIASDARGYVDIGEVSLTPASFVAEADPPAAAVPGGETAVELAAAPEAPAPDLAPGPSAEPQREARVITVAGTAVDAGGGLISAGLGFMEPEFGEGRTIVFQTDTSGRFIADGVEPGRYVVDLGNGEVVLDVSAASGDYVDFGAISFTQAVLP